MDVCTNILTKFSELTKKPVKYLSAQDEIKEDVAEFIKTVYDFTKSQEEDTGLEPLKSDALPELVIDGFDDEQLWQEIELQNTAKWDQFINNVSTCVSKKNMLLFPVKENNETINDSENEENLQEHRGSPVIEDSENNLMKKAKVKKQTDNKKTVNQPKSASIVDDDFFKLKEMERFLVAEDKKEIISHKPFKKKKDSDDEDSIDLFQDPSEEDDDDDEDQDGNNIRYKDFFDAPDNYDSTMNTDNQPENNSQDHEMDGANDGLDDDIEEDDDDSEEDDHEIENLEIGDSKKKPLSKKKVKFNLGNDSESEDSESGNEVMGQLTTQTEKEGKLSEYEQRQKRLRQRISKLEESNLSEKPWQLKGEVTATSRPQNSLLEEVVDFDLTTRPLPIITEETTLKLEDIITQRVKDKVWDDVERKAKPVQDPQEYRKKVILDQEKSKLSLAQVYEQEFLKQKQSLSGDTDQTEEEPKEHTEIKSAMDKLFAKLDALSNYHYTPKEAQPEVKIVSNMPAIFMEEVAPVATSDAALLAPEEIKAKRKGELMSKSERTDTDKKRERRKKKKLQRVKELEKQNKLLTKANLGLGNKYSKEKASKTINKATADLNGNDKMAQMHDTKALKSSKAFFTQLTDDMSSTIKKTNKSKTVLPAKKYKL